MKIAEILNYLEKVAPSKYQESYDNARLITGNKNWECNGALHTLDCIESVVDEAIALNYNLIIAHHPIVFSGLKSFTGKNYIERTIIKAIKNDIAIFAIHTNLDNVVEGVNAKICEKIGLVNCKILAPKKEILQKLYTFVPIKDAENVRNAMFEVGAGAISNYENCSFNITGIGSFKGNENSNPTIGEKNKLHFEEETKIEVIFPNYLQNKVVTALKNAHPYEEVAFDIVKLENKHNLVGSGMFGSLSQPQNTTVFLHHIKKTFNCEIIKHTKIIKETVKTIAVCGGSGSFLLNNAKAKNADVFITSDYKYHQFFDANDEILIADIGHFESEQFTSELLYEIINKKFSNFANQISKIKTNPVKYL